MQRMDMNFASLLVSKLNMVCPSIHSLRFHRTPRTNEVLNYRILSCFFPFTALCLQSIGEPFFFHRFYRFPYRTEVIILSTLPVLSITTSAPPVMVRRVPASKGSSKIQTGVAIPNSTSKPSSYHIRSEVTLPQNSFSILFILPKAPVKYGSCKYLSGSSVSKTKSISDSSWACPLA